jgi:hypothetical protein
MSWQMVVLIVCFAFLAVGTILAILLLRLWENFFKQGEENWKQTRERLEENRNRADRLFKK